jgi:hypothetical protein
MRVRRVARPTTVPTPPPIVNGAVRGGGARAAALTPSLPDLVGLAGLTGFAGPADRAGGSLGGPRRPLDGDTTDGPGGDPRSGDGSGRFPTDRVTGPRDGAAPLDGLAAARPGGDLTDGRPGGLARRVPGAQMPSGPPRTIGRSSSAHTGGPPDDVYGFLDNSTAGVQRGLDDIRRTEDHEEGGKAPVPSQGASDWPHAVCVRTPDAHTPARGILVIVAS